MIKRDVDVRSLPDFSDIENVELRTQNRGAILANIFEDYYKESQTASYSFKFYLELSEGYLELFPLKEHASIKEAMTEHLSKRGYRFGC